MKPIKPNERGGTILIVITVIAVLAVMVGAALDYTSTVGENVRRSLNQSAAESIGNGVLQHEFMYWREISRENTTYSSGLTTSAYASIPLPTSSMFPNVANFTATSAVDATGAFTVSNCKVVAVTPQYTLISGTSTAPSPSSGPVPTSGTSNGTQSFSYLASVDVSLPTRFKAATFKARQIFEKQVISPWNWALFYVDPLEIHPGAPFTINGWVQTNSDLYTGHSLLTFGGKVNYGSQWYIGFMSGDSTHPETPQSPNYPANMPPSFLAQQQPFGLDSTRALNTTDSNPNNDSYHELIEIPVAGNTDPFASTRYYDQASVRILVDNNNNVTIKNASDTTITNNSASSTDKALYNAFKGAISTNSSIQDNREGATIRLVTLDVSKVTTAVNSGLSGFNGVVYIDDTSADPNGGSPHRAVRLKNGSVAPTGGLTVASGNPVYIQGDYNTGSNPPSNSGNTSQPNASNYTRQPCAVVADALNILSNNWSDSDSTNSLGGRGATNTTINAAVIAGIVPSGNGNYSGGAENFPRFLEDWSNDTLTYYGSMVELFQSKQADGIWGQGNVYNPPTRAWSFDTNYTTNPPPGSIMVINYLRKQWWQE